MVPRDSDGSDKTNDYESEAPDEEFETDNDSDEMDVEESSDDAKAGSTRELRYEGPITFDDEYEDDYEDEPRGSRFFVTAAILGGAVTIIFALAMILRPDAADKIETESTPASLAALSQSNSPETGVPESSSDARGNEPMAAADFRSQENNRAYDYREIPDRPAAEPERAAPRINRPERPDPVPASRTTRQDSTPPASTEPTASWKRMKEMLDQNRVTDAAIVGGLYLKNRRPSEWTLQVLFACSSATVRRAFDKESDPNLVVSAARLNGRSCYRLTWGSYATRSEALSGISSVPTYFTKEGKPRPLATHSIE